MQRKTSIIPALFAFILTLALFLSAMSPQADAQADPTPTPVIEDWYIQTDAEWNLPYTQPGTSSGTALWETIEPTFTSNYPSGFSFSIDVHSDQGDIVLASIIWSHTPYKLKRGEISNAERFNGHFEYTWYAVDMLPPWVAVNYYWSFVDSAGNRFRTNWILGHEYAPTDSAEWTRAESADVIVFLQAGLPQETIDLTFAAMESQRETFRLAWGELLPYKPRAILFRSERDFQEWRGMGFGGSGIIGQTSDEWGATAQVIVEDNPYDLAYGTVLHEVAHLYQLAAAPRVFVGSSWFTEGNATLFELHQQYNYEERIREIALSGQLPLMLQGDGPLSFSTGPDSWGRYGYDLGFTFWKWIVMQYGLEKHQEIMNLLRLNTPRNEALELSLGMTVFQIETAWAQWLGASAAAPTHIPTQAYVFPPTVTPFVFPTNQP